MLREIYIRPLGLYAAQCGDNAEEVWGGFRVAGGWLDFSAVEVIERNGANVERRIAGIGEFLERDWGRRTLNAADMFEYIRDNIMLSVQHVERTAIEMRHSIGIDNLMFATDFPHIECEWPNTKPTLERLTANLSPEEKYKIVAGNVIDYFDLDASLLERSA